MDTTKPRTQCAYKLRPKKSNPPTPPPCLPKPKTRKPPKSTSKGDTSSKPKPSTSRQGSAPSSSKKNNGPSTSRPRMMVCPRPGRGRRGVMPTRPAPPPNVFCAVCLDTEDHGAATRQLFCGHNFHVKCVESWLKNNYSCPVCRSPPDAMTDAYMVRFQMFAQNMRQWFSQRPRYSRGGWSFR